MLQTLGLFIDFAVHVLKGIMRTRMNLAGAGVVLMGSRSSVVAFTSPAVGGLRPRPLGQSTQQRACRWPSLCRSVLPMKAMMDPATVCVCDPTTRPTVQDPTHCRPAAVFELFSSRSRVLSEPLSPFSFSQVQATAALLNPAHLAAISPVTIYSD